MVDKKVKDREYVSETVIFVGYTTPFGALRYSLWVIWLGGLSLGSAAQRLLKVEADINGILDDPLLSK